MQVGPFFYDDLTIQIPQPKGTQLIFCFFFPVTYFLCFSGACCRDPSFQRHIEFIKQDIEDLQCSTPVQCASANALFIHAISCACVALASMHLLF